MPNLIKTGKIPEKDLLRIKNEITKIAKKAGRALVGDGKVAHYKPEKRESQIFFTDSEETRFTFNYLTSIVIEHYSSIGLPLNDFAVQYAKYEVGGHFVEHDDVIYSKSDRIRGFTFSINITPEDEYTGGDLVLTYDNITLDRAQGSFIIFPAYKKHKVEVVTSGTREAIVVWVHVSEKNLKWLKNYEQLP